MAELIINGINRSRSTTLFALMLSFSTVACDVRTEDSAVEEVTLKQHQSSADNEFRSDGPSAPVVLIQWQFENLEEARASFPVRVTNNARSTCHLSLALEASLSQLSTKDTVLGQWSLASGESREVQITLEDMPVQSSLHAVPLRVLARYTLGSEGADENLSFSESLLVTSSEDFRTATARTLTQQMKKNGLIADISAHLATPGTVLRRESSGAFSKVELNAAVDGSGPSLVLDGPPPYAQGKINDIWFPDTAPAAEEH